MLKHVRIKKPNRWIQICTATEHEDMHFDLHLIITVHYYVRKKYEDQGSYYLTINGRLLLIITNLEDVHHFPTPHVLWSVVKSTGTRNGEYLQHQTWSLLFPHSVPKVHKYYIYQHLSYGLKQFFISLHRFWAMGHKTNGSTVSSF